MSTRGNYNGKLSEKDQLIKSLRDKQKNINNPKLQKAISQKLDVIESDKPVQK